MRSQMLTLAGVSTFVCVWEYVRARMHVRVQLGCAQLPTVHSLCGEASPLILKNQVQAKLGVHKYSMWICMAGDGCCVDAGMGMPTHPCTHMREGCVPAAGALGSVCPAAACPCHAAAPPEAAASPPARPKPVRWRLALAAPAPPPPPPPPPPGPEPPTQPSVSGAFVLPPIPRNAFGRASLPTTSNCVAADSARANSTSANTNAGVTIVSSGGRGQRTAGG